MKAILQHEIGPAEALYIGEYERPLLKTGEVLVQTHAFALNRADILQRKGKYPSPAGASPLMGLEISGRVVDAGTSSRWRVGDAVFGLVAGGGYAEYTAVDEGMLLSKPEAMSFEEAAALPEVFLTAFLALVRMGRMQAGERVLIHGAAGGVGTAAIQIAKQMGCLVAATVAGDKQEVCRALGADLCLDYKQAPWRETLEGAWGRSPINVLLDVIGASYLADNLEVLAMDGRMSMLALIGGGDAAAVDLRKVIGKRLKIEGSTLRNRPLAYQRGLMQEMSAWALPLLQEGKIRAIVDKVFPWEEIVQAHQRMEAGEHVGKMVLKIL